MILIRPLLDKVTGKEDMFRERSRIHALLLILGYAVIALVYQGYSRFTAPSDSIEAFIDASQPLSALDVRSILPSQHLSGQLIFLEQRNQPYYRILQFDFVNQSLQSIFDVSEGALVYQIALAPTCDCLLMTYSPASDNPVPSHNGLYQLNLQNNAPPELLLDANEDNFFAYPQWSSDGAYIYYVVYSTIGDDRNRRRIERLDLASGEIELIADNATLPNLSADDNHLAYIHINPETGLRSLRVVDLADRREQELIAVADYPDLDSPLFYGDSLFFSVLNTEPRQAHHWGAAVYAHGDHNQPANWYQFMDDSDAQPITDEDLVLMGGAFSDDGRYLAWVSTLGVYVTDLNDNTSIHVLRSRAIRSLIWQP